MFKIIIIVWFFLGLLVVLTYAKMVDILVENKKGSWWYFYWEFLFTYRHFKKFIKKGDLTSGQKKEYLFLYKIGVFAVWGVFLYFITMAIIMFVLINFFPDKLEYLLKN